MNAKTIKIQFHFILSNYQMKKFRDSETLRINYYSMSADKLWKNPPKQETHEMNTIQKG